MPGLACLGWRAWAGVSGLACLGWRELPSSPPTHRRAPGIVPGAAAFAGEQGVFGGLTREAVLHEGAPVPPGGCVPDEFRAARQVAVFAMRFLTGIIQAAPAASHAGRRWGAGQTCRSSTAPTEHLPRTTGRRPSRWQRPAQGL
ncbi:hypothetical protein DGI_1043 [Megalodesulfovibrio gigas DSM 1382 = ATCC 19364]|uniref:Uncharacterized protein n=1 Tax=Megalodesulfovibrio gigas (strain ATCC 19364 / DSM 1382 / NCIMB 9332 / VKM B-1759) TaxID=1121448 RepID=T2G9F3_MEGG1|nr:hypothetical protein DGI_1043 [Megalodesulfovibrio gigas DSM 1382 = ATCC 19364]